MAGEHVEVRFKREQIKMLRTVMALHMGDVSVRFDECPEPLVLLHDVDGDVFDEFRLPERDMRFFREH